MKWNRRQDLDTPLEGWQEPQQESQPAPPPKLSVLAGRLKGLAGRWTPRLRTVGETAAVAFGMFSAIPVPQPQWNERNMRYALCAFPLVGVVCAVCAGKYQGSPAASLEILFQQLLGLESTYPEMTVNVVMGLRIPRSTSTAMGVRFSGTRRAR